MTSRLLMMGLLLLPGCTVTKLTMEPGPAWTLRRVSFLQKLEIPEVEVATNGTAVLRGYKSDGGHQAAAAITAAAVSAAIKSMKP